tara:strand:+ start:9646 stop:9789 length:144 start_codon:yes stop_codon:yes gene_type:complete
MIDWVTTTTLNEEVEIIYEYIYATSYTVEDVDDIYAQKESFPQAYLD